MLGAGFLAIWTSYHVAGFLDQRVWMGDLRPSVVLGWNVLWPANFHMFTNRSTKHTEPVFEGFFPEPDGDQPAGWRPLPMAEWYPARWESGYRWERPPVYKYSEASVPFLIAACEKSGALATRLVLEKWKARLGRMDQPKRNPTREARRDWDCALKGPKPQGLHL